MSEIKTWVKFEKITEDYGKFTVEPLAPGMGITIGNCVRRVLLSSIQGAAVTAIEIEGVEHEFTSLDDVVEDVLDIICNVKGIVFVSHTDDTKILTIDFKGKGSITAKDIQTDADVEIINPNRHIAELTKERKFKMTLRLEKGIGYSPSEAHILDDQSVNTICVDASFSPIERVNPVVEKVRVGRSLDYDSLKMDIWTNGSIDTESAVKEAANILISQIALFGDLNQKPKINVQKEEVDPDEKKKESALRLTIEDLELSARSLNCLKKAGIDNVSELIEKDLSELIQIKNFGKKSAEEINGKLSQYGLALKGEIIEV